MISIKIGLTDRKAGAISDMFQMSSELKFKAPKWDLLKFIMLASDRARSDSLCSHIIC